MFKKIIKKKMRYQIKINEILFSLFRKITSIEGMYEVGFKEIPIIFTYSYNRKDLNIAYEINVKNIEILTCYCIDEIDDFKNSRLFKHLINLKELSKFYS